MMHLKRLLALILFSLVTPLAAQSPEDLVRWVYLSYSNPDTSQPRGFFHLTEPAQRRQYLSERFAVFFDKNDTHGDDLATACIDFGFDIPGQDYDQAEIARTLTLSTDAGDARQTVTAMFNSFGTPTEVSYVFIPVDGVWRIDDVVGEYGRASEIPCEAKAGTASTSGGETGYCYKTENDTLRLFVGADGQGRFDLESWQANGHSCSARGAVQPTEGGWLHTSGTCTLQILVSDAGGLRIVDPDWRCKETQCGARAVLDGLTYDTAAQRDCVTMPAQ